MPDKRRTAAEQLGDVLEIKLLLFEKSLEAFGQDVKAGHAALSKKIDYNREVVETRLGGIEDQLKLGNDHFKELNGSVKKSSEDIIVLQEQQKGNYRFRKGVWWFIGAVTSAGLFAAGVAIVNHL